MKVEYSIPPYEAPWWLRNGHLNTVYGFLRRRGPALPATRSVWLTVEPGVELLLRLHWQPQPAPALLLVHGLEGSSDVGYMLTMAEMGYRRGWHVVRMNVRGCGESETRCSTLYNSGMSGDVGRALEWLVAQPEVTAAALGGYSMGGNLVLKYAGEAGKRVPAALQSVVAVCACLDLDACATALHRPVNYFYERRFLENLKGRSRRYESRHPGTLPLEAAQQTRSVRGFDDLITGPFTGYRDAADYYAGASAANWLQDIRAPTLAIHAEDDPFIAITAASRAKLAANPAINFYAARHGGHCSFVSSRRGARRDGSVYWAESRVIEFSAAHFQAAGVEPARVAPCLT